MILAKHQIKWAQEKGYLYISDWKDERLNPNSYNLSLADELMVYDCDKLDIAEDLPVKMIKIPKKGYWLKPGRLYLGRTAEYTATHRFIPMLEGRSSIGRLGVGIHVTAGFGDIGFSGYWTLEITCVQPTKIYPGVEICQIYYHTIGPDSDIWIPNDDTIAKYSSGKYQNNTGIQKSQLYLELSQKWKEFK